MGWGQQDAYWIAYYTFAEQIGVKYAPERSRQLQLWVELAESCGWWWSYRGFVIISDRPTTVKMEPTGRNSIYRLHCTDGPALAFGDGWAVYALHGIRVPEQVIMAPATLTVEQISGEANLEVRRIMIERFGANRYMRESGAELVHRDDWGTLWRIELSNDEPMVMVEVVNSTPEPDGTVRNYMLRVPPTMTTAKAAVAWTFGHTPQSYRPAIQT